KGGAHVPARKASDRGERPCRARGVVVAREEWLEKLLRARDITLPQAFSRRKNHQLWNVPAVAERARAARVALLGSAERQERLRQTDVARDLGGIHLGQAQELFARLVVHARGEEDARQVRPRWAEAWIDFERVAIVLGGDVRTPLALGENAERVMG